jgi:hypothetical protein
MRRESPYIIPGQAAKREPPAVDFEQEDMMLGPGNVCPVKDCDAWAYPPDEPGCEHEYPGKCVACDLIVGDRYADLVWMGEKEGQGQWLCESCRGYCESCNRKGQLTFDGVCGDCCRVVTADGTVLHDGHGVSDEGPTMQLLWPEGTWHRIDGGLYCEECDVAEAEETEEFFTANRDGETRLVCWSCLLGRPVVTVCGHCHKVLPIIQHTACCEKWWDTEAIRLPRDVVRRLEAK